MRGRHWIAGFLLGIAAAATVPEDRFPSGRAVVAGLTFLGVGIAGELLPAFHRREPAHGLLDLRPADGRVEVARVVGVRREPNLHDDRFGRFLGLDIAKPAARREATRRSPPLLGRVVIASLFIGRHGRGWPDAEVADAHANLLRAGRWIEREAGRYGAAVNVELADAYFIHDDFSDDAVAVGFQAEGDDVGPFEVGAGVKALVKVNRAAVALGFPSARAFFDAIESRIVGDATVWLVLPREAGRSFAMPGEGSEWEGLSLAVCYPREASFPERLAGPARLDSATVVHEVMHLFGATDKYNVALNRFAPRSVSGREVMRLDETRLSRLRVDPATAREIGWLSPA